MNQRPAIDSTIDAKTFRSYYYLKEELVDFLRSKDLPTSGNKIELTERIAHYLETGEILSLKKETKPKQVLQEITEETLIEPNFVCSELHRAFFQEKIGPSFSFLVPFQKWLKENTGKTYSEAISAYAQILQEKQTKKGTIDRQFEYNTYIRDFFANHPGYSLKDAITCWNHKKSLPGTHRYEPSDLIALDQVHD